jgi:hypothetical protein
VPTINARLAQATVEGDRVRIFQEIIDTIGMEQFDAQLQEYLEGAMRAAAAEALVKQGGVEHHSSRSTSPKNKGRQIK